MASYTSSNTEPERWAKIVKGEESGRYPEIMIDDGTLKAVSKPEDRAARIQTFLADVFNDDDDDNQWFSAAGDPAEASEETAADEGEPESSETKKVSLTQHRADKREEKKDQERAKHKEELPRDDYTNADWQKITTEVSRGRVKGVFLEGGKVIGMDQNGFTARGRLEKVVDIALNLDGKTKKPRMLRKMIRPFH